MAQFRYESLKPDGTPTTGVLAADSRAGALRLLAGRGEVATHIEPISDKQARELQSAMRNGVSAGSVALQPSSAADSFSFGFKSRKPSLSRTELANLIRELATALEAGLPVMQALRTVRKQAPRRTMGVILDHLIERVEAGAPLHQAAKEYGPPFDDMIVGMMRAADASGKMSDILLQLADLLDRSVELRREVTGATIYPAIIMLLIIASIIFIMTVIAPRLLEPLMMSANFEMPWPTAVVIGVAEFTKQYWIHVLVGIALLYVIGRWWLSIPANRLWFDHMILRLPVLGPLLRDVAVARFTRTLGTLTAAGLPILEALRITSGTLGNRALQQAIDNVGERVTAGSALADPLEKSGLFPALLIQIVNLGERSGRLEGMLLHAANSFDRQVNSSIKVFTKSLPPLLIIGLAPIVVFTIAAIVLPLLEAQAAFGG